MVMGMSAMNINEKFKNKTDYVNIIDDVVKKIFKLELPQGTKRIYVDVNSTFSIIYAQETKHINVDVVKHIVLECVQEIISKAQMHGAKVVFIYTAEKSILHTSIYPDWCKNRYDRDMISKPDYLTAVLKYLAELSTSNPIVSVVNTHEFHPAYYIYFKEAYLVNNKNHEDKIIILSKDPVFYGIPYDGVEFFTGVLLSINDHKATVGNYIKNTNLSRIQALFYLLLAGDDRNEYKGVLGVGPKKALDFINYNLVNIMLNDMGEATSYPYKEFIETHRPLYFIDKGLEKLKELGIDTDKIKNL